MSLWEEARKDFESQLRASKEDDVAIKAFLEDQTSLEDARRSATTLNDTCDQKFVPKKWTNRIMRNLEIFTTVGDAVLTAAPESVAVAWFATSFILKAINDGYKLYETFGTGLQEITDLMILGKKWESIYRKLEQQRGDDVYRQILINVRVIYVLILDFSYAVKTHVSAKRKRDRVAHGWNHFIGIDTIDFQDKTKKIQENREKTVKLLETAFQAFAIDSFEDVSDELNSISLEIRQANEFQQSSAAEWKAITKELKLIRAPSHRELAIRDFDKNLQRLVPWLDESSKLLETRFQEQEKGTCEWMDEIQDFQDWSSASDNVILCLHGVHSTGKSVLGACLCEKMQSTVSADSRTIVAYMASQRNARDDSTDIVKLIENSLVRAVYQVAHDDSCDEFILQRCNQVFTQPKQRKKATSSEPPQTSGRSMQTQSSSIDPVLDLTETLVELLEYLKRDLILVIDDLDGLSQELQEQTAAYLLKLKSEDRLKIKILLICQPENKLRYKVVDKPSDEIAISKHNLNDIKLLIAQGLENLVGISSEERVEIEDTLIRKASNRFGFIKQTALPFLRTPFHRPIAQWLLELPEDTDEMYSRHLQQLSPSFRGLLQIALTWLMTSRVPPRVEEIIEAHSGTYTSNITSLERDSTDARVNLRCEQIEQAGGPFLEVRSREHVFLKDAKSIRDFFGSSSSTAEEAPKAQICARCKDSRLDQAGLVVNEREDHLNMAITCLKHLNSPYFQTCHFSEHLHEAEERAGHTVKDQSTNIQQSPTNEEDRGQTNLPHVDEKVQNPHASGLTADAAGRDATSEDVTPATNASTVQNQAPTTTSIHSQQPGSLSAEDTTAKDKTLEQSVQDLNIKEDTSVNENEDISGSKASTANTDNKNGVISSAADDTDDDASVFSDKLGDETTILANETDEDEDSEDKRYEVTEWFWHVQEAERLWPEVERKDAAGWTELKHEMRKFFISQPVGFEAWKMDYAIPGAQDRSPMMWSADLGLTTVAELLLAEGLSIMDATPDGFTALDFAVHALRPVDMLLFYLANGGDVRKKSPDTPPILHNWLFWGSDAECVGILLGHGASPSEVSGSWPQNGMHVFGARGTDLAVFDRLIVDMTEVETHATLNARDGNGETPLHRLLSRTDIPMDILKAFISHGADVNAEDEASERPIYEAALEGEVAAVELLLNDISDVNDENGIGWTALHIAAHYGQAKTVELLLRKADPNRTDHRNRTALFLACLLDRQGFRSQTDHAKCAELLLQKQISCGTTFSQINSPSKSGRTPLREAAARGFTNVVSTIIGQMQSDDDKKWIDHRDLIRGRNALHSAAVHGRPETIALLIQSGADPKLRSGKEGKDMTSLELCLDRWAVAGLQRYEAAMVLLIDANEQAARTNTSLSTVAAMHGSISILQKLDNLGADLTQSDAFGWTPAQLATQYGQADAESWIRRCIERKASRPSQWKENTSMKGKTLLKEDAIYVSHDGGHLTCLSADHPAPADSTLYYYELEILDPETGDSCDTQTDGVSDQVFLALGFSTSFSAQLIDYPGCEPLRIAPNIHSWAYHADDGRLCESATANYSTDKKTLHYGPGDTVGCGLNKEKKQVFFTRNGVKIDETFGNLHGRVFPLLGLEEKVKVRTNFGRNLVARPFKWQGQDDGEDSKKEEVDKEGDKTPQET